jgi:tetratricopeptide (TPR) repeat protein
MNVFVDMKRLICLFCATALCGLAGCGQRTEVKLDSVREKGQTGGRSVATVEPALDPRAIVLAPHSGDTELDRQIVRLQRLIPQSSNSVPLFEQLGWSFVQKARADTDPGFYKLAEQCATSIERTEPGSADAMLLHGHLLQNLHRFKEAEPLARELAARRGLPFDFGLLGDVLMEQGQLGGAIDAYQRMVDLRPDPHAYARIAHLRWLTGDLAGALEVMRPAARASSPRDAESGAWFWSRLALYEWQAGEWTKAWRASDAALELQKDCPMALLVKGRMLLSEGKSAEAVVPLRRAADVNPLPEYRWVLAEAFREAESETEAAEIEAQLQRSGAADDPRTFSLFLATRRERPALALRLAERELHERGDVHTHDAMAWALAASGRWEEAWGHSQQALAEGTQDARLFLHAGVIAEKLSQPDEAIRLLRNAEQFQQMLLPSERDRLRQTKQGLAVAAANRALSPARTPKALLQAAHER